jgi:hypothetical protein
MFYYYFNENNFFIIRTFFKNKNISWFQKLFLIRKIKQITTSWFLSKFTKKKVFNFIKLNN